MHTPKNHINSVNDHIAYREPSLFVLLSAMHQTTLLGLYADDDGRGRGRPNTLIV